MKPLVGLSIVAAVTAPAMISTSVPYLAVPRGAAVILDTGSTNTSGYRIVVTQSGSAASVLADGRRADRQLTAAAASRFFADVRAAMPLSKIAVAPCMKSASFGTSRYVWWRGERTPDITCPGAPALARDVEEIARALFGTNQPPKNAGAAHVIAPLPNEPRKVLPSPAPTGSR